LAATRLLRHQRTSTLQQDGVQALLAPGDIVIRRPPTATSRTNYGMVLSGRSRFTSKHSDDGISMYGAVPLKTIKQRC